MNINNYSIYSAVSLTGNRDEAELLKVLELADKFSEINKISEAKEYLEASWHVNKPVEALPIGANCVLTTKENDRCLSINFSYNDENITYYYQK